MERLTKIQVGLRVTKDKNGDKGRFKFRSAEDIFEKLKPLLEETKTAVVVSDELVEIGGTLAVKATASLLCTSNSGVLATATGFAIYDKHEIVKRDTGEVISTMSNEQCTGSASSYARKYALCGLFAIDNDESDPDQPDIKKAGSSQPKQQSKPAPQQKPKQDQAPQPKQPAQPLQLTEEEENNYTELCADLDNADCVNTVLAIALMAEGQKYELSIRKAAAKKGIQLAANSEEIHKAYDLIKGREGWQELQALATSTAKTKGFIAQ